MRFKLDGRARLVDEPITGLALYAAAGSPAVLTTGGKPVPKTSDEFEMVEDQKFHTGHVTRAQLERE